MITLWGKPWSGKSTVAKILVDKLNYERIAIGDMKRAIAAEMGLSISEFNTLWELPWNEERFDLAYDRYQQSLDPQWPIILEWRMSYFNQPHAFKVFLDVDDWEAATRIFLAQRTTDASTSLEEVHQITTTRNAADQKRRYGLYGSDFMDLTHYNLVIETTHLAPQQIVSQIIDAYQDWKKRT
jgi:cytidylate kinase